MRIRCNRCFYLDYDLLSKRRVFTSSHFCGVHGMCSIDPNGKQINLDSRGSCDFLPFRKKEVIQLTFNFD